MCIRDSIGTLLGILGVPVGTDLFCIFGGQHLSLIHICTQFVRSRQWNKLVAVDGVLCTVATMAFYVLYLVGFKWGANGYLLAIISGDLVSVLFLSVTGKLWNYVELKGVNKNLWKQMLRFSLPMIPAQISFWIINASDLFFVREMCNGLDGRDGNAWSLSLIHI